MGLDMHAHRVQKEEVAYWRKHNMLHGWMEQLWNSRGHEGTFNCVTLELYEEDIDQLEKDIENFNLPETKGFFFGGGYTKEEYEEYYKDDDLAFIKSCREAFAEGDGIIYDSWW